MSQTQTDELLKEFAPQLEHTGLKGKIWIGFLIFMVCMGLFALYWQVSRGHIVTGMRDNVVWGVYIVNFIFFMGISYAGALISGTLHLFHAEWRKPVIRMAEFITVISLLIGPLYIMLCIGRLDRLPNLILFGRIQSPITWDVIAISTDIIGCFIFLYLAILRDLSKLRDYEALKVPAWQKKLYKMLALGYTGTPEQQIRLKRATDIMAGMVIAIAIIVYSVLAWIFSVTLQPGWHSTIFGPYFVIAAVYSGTGVLILAMFIFRKVYHLEKHITQKHFVNVGVIMLVLAAFFGYFTFSEYLTKWYGSEKNDEILIKILFKDYYFFFIFSNYVGVLLPLIVVGFKKLRTINNITITAVVVIIALWMNRYLIVVPTLESPYLPIQDARAAWLHYSPTWVEMVLTAGGVASFCLFFTIASKLIPIVQVAELKEEPKESGDIYLR
ncbi:MAG: polysulfide reductase NrfD [Bacteroidetes bacterium]|nr:polysulfide reductase NrfD [Bacteroidota bacterium]